LKRNSQ